MLLINRADAIFIIEDIAKRGGNRCCRIASNKPALLP
ncbi:hypothetical protein FHS82_000250 [Pseudochelatococcus lubricantis]|uniref:Uncharacterized protein n=1 Tax=Pseudochelatococcus lubricantis TaxID=1538102 RepID=A0ABX0UU05_9HYPH|nr:hypothetical protein [Pseudochelatococcus lubricantis]